MLLITTWKSFPYFAIIAAAILLPELYLHRGWSLRKLMTIRLITLLVTCIAATAAALWAVPSLDVQTEFTRAFIYIGVCRMIILSSHQYAERKPERAQDDDAH